MKKALACALLILMTACSSDPRPEILRLDYSSLGKINLNTADLRIIDRSQNTPRYAPYVGQNFRPSLSDAVHRLVADRLQASGSLGHATLIIKEANVTEQSLATESGFSAMFDRQQASKYIGRVEVTLEAQNPADASVGMAEAHAVYAISLPEDPKEFERQDAYNRLLTNLMTDLNNQLEKSINTHMKRFLSSSTIQSERTAPTRDSALAPQ